MRNANGGQEYRRRRGGAGEMASDEREQMGAPIMVKRKNLCLHLVTFHVCGNF